MSESEPEPDAPSAGPPWSERAELPELQQGSIRGPLVELDQSPEVEALQQELRVREDELREMRAELETNLGLYTELFEFAPIGYATIGVDRNILELNHAAAALLGRTRSELVGKNLVELISEADGGRMDAKLGLLFVGDAEQRLQWEATLRRHPGRNRQVQFTAILRRRDQPLVLLACEDISERKDRQARLERTERALREADRRKDEFLAALSHELRNPLAPIRNSLFVLGHVEPASAQAQRARVVIERQVRHLTHLVDALLDVTRIVHGRIELARRRVEVGDLLHAAIEDHRLSFEQSGVELEEHFGSGPFWIQGDPERLIQIASNLLDNALKFTPSGGRVEVRLDLDRDGEKVVIQVDDTGVGIAPEMREQLFQPFSQAPQSIARTHGGLGLGLATVKGLMQLHGGDIHVASPGSGQGTQVTLRLPADGGPASSVQPLPERPARKRRVLVIEDNPDASETLKEALALNGHDVRLASDGPRALAIADSFLPDVVICDIGLPGMDGYAVARAFRSAERLRDVYLVALSGYARPADRRRAAEAGFNQHFAKPSSLTGLARLVAEAPSGRQ